MNLYSFIENLKNVSLAHYDVKEFNFGDVYGVMNKKNHKYPCVVLTIDNIQKGQNDTNIVNGNLFYIDRQLADESNKLYIQSQGVSVLNNILIKYYQNIGYPFDTQQFTPFSEKFADLCAGAYCTFSSLVDIEGICDDENFMSKILNITENGLYTVAGYDSVDVNVHPTDVFNYFTLYPSNYIYANYLDLSTEIVANVKFTGDKDFYFCSDEKGLIGLYFNAEENETYAWWNGDRKALHFHKKDWEKGFYKIQFKAGRLQIGYLTWTLDSSSSTTSFDPLYFGYYQDKTSPMEIEYITISASIGTLYDYRPKINDEYAKLVEVISGKNADIRTVYSATLKLNQSVIDDMSDTQKSQLAAKG